MTIRTIEEYEEIFRKNLLNGYINQYIDSIPVNELLFLLNRIFKEKQIAINRLAIYIKSEAEVKNRPINIVISNLMIYTYIFMRYININDDGIWQEGFSEEKPI
jgi:hypothetical protein